MNKPVGITDSELDRALGEYYRKLGQLSHDGPLQQDALVLDKARRHWPLAAIVRLAASIALGAALIGSLIVSRGWATVPGAVPAASSPAPTFTANGRADQAGLMRSGGIWATRGSSLYTSTDNGATWRTGTYPVAQNTGVYPVVDVFVLDSDHAWTVSLALPLASQSSFVGHAKLWINRTSDGGQTWSHVDAPGSCTYPTAKLSFVDKDHGFLDCGDVGTIAGTDDGGATWVAEGKCPYLGLGSIEASDQSTLWITSSHTLIGSATVLAVSRDSGRTWTSVQLPGLDSVPSNATLTAPIEPTFTDASHGLVAVSVDLSQQLPQVRFFRTSDSGRTWATASKQVSYHFNQIAEVAEVADGSRLVTVVVQHLSVSSDGGLTWQDFDAAGLPANEPFNWISFTDSLHGVALVFVAPGPQALLLSDDGGRNWHSADLGAAAH